MLKHLHIENYALIESLDIDLHHGFSVITGETGAGKSILLGALGLLTGDRADLSAIQAGKQKCTLEACFELEGTQLEEFFQEVDLDYDPKECTLRRELTSGGKSRAFINDTPTTLSTLKQLGNRLIDIHSQHQNLLLSEENFQLSVLDVVAGNTDLLHLYSCAYKNWKLAQRKHDEASRSLQQSKEEEDYKRFLLKELKEFGPKEGEDETLQQRCDLLEHAQDIQQAMMTGYNVLAEGDNAVMDVLRQVRSKLSSIESVFPLASELAERVESCRIELQDIADTLYSEGETIDCDPQELTLVQSRLAALFSLEQKHHADSSSELMRLMSSLQDDLDKIDNGDETIRLLQQQEEKARQETVRLANQLSKARHEILGHIEGEMVEGLKSLGMKNARFKVEISPLDTPSTHGMDKVAFLFSANLGNPLQQVAQVASGGETARVMLCLKALLSGALALPTIVFDEIDTGVSGQIAEAMGHIMQNMGKMGRQVISITHLPQIAALGEHHLRVWKEDAEGHTLSHISQLTTEKRVEEIANMLSGCSVSDEAVNNAKALLGLKGS